MRDYFRLRSTMQLPSTEYNFRPRNTTSVHGRQLPSTSAPPRSLIHCFQHERANEPTWTASDTRFLTHSPSTLLKFYHHFLVVHPLSQRGW